VVVTVSCQDSIWAGDVNFDKIADNLDILPLALSIGSTGPARAVSSIVWLPSFGRDWTSTVPGFAGVNGKHADCDGDGTVSIGDTLAIVQNYGLTHPKGTHEPARKTAGLPDLYFDLTGINVAAGRKITVPVLMGSSTSPVSAMAGIAARIMIEGITPADTPTLSYAGSWLGNSSNTLRFEKGINSNRLDWAFARTDRQNVSASGVLAWLTFTLPAGTAGQEMRLYFDRVVVVEQDGREVVDFNIVDDSVTILEASGVVAHAKPSAWMTVMPNPSTGPCRVTLNLPAAGPYSLGLYDISGRLVLQSSGSGVAGLQQIALPAEMLSAGVYQIRLNMAGVQVAPVRWLKGE
jgi:hypothetical protein